MDTIFEDNIFFEDQKKQNIVHIRTNTLSLSLFNPLNLY